MKPIRLALSFKDVLLVPQYSAIRSRSEVTLSTYLAPGLPLQIPLISMGMDTVTGVDMAIAMHKLGGIGLLPRYDSPQIQAEKVTKIKKSGAEIVASIGLREDPMERAKLLIKAGAIGITIDIAHAHTAHTLKLISEFKNTFKKTPLIAGTIATYDGAVALFKAGADSVRVGVGGGTICTTRIVAGSGVPQITAVMEAARAKRLYKNRMVIVDGGMSNSGDIVKGLAAGADAAMCGSLFAGTDEAPGAVIEKSGIFYKEYNGSTSSAEKERQIQKSKAPQKPHFVLHVEGVAAMVPYKGPVKDVIDQLCAGIRSGLTYSGARNINELHKKAQFIQITSAGLAESQAHDVILRT